MARTVAVGVQDFEKIVSNGYFYIDKTNFIKEWWESADEVTLITRPRRFGKTLNMNMLERFWSIKYKGQGKIFENLFIWGEEKFQKLQGTYPVISLSFAGVKEDNYPGAKSQINQIITNLYSEYEFLRDCGKLGEKDKAFFDRIGHGMENSDAAMSLNRLSEYLFRYYGKKVIILLDEYDTPMQEAYVNGYWKELLSFIRNLFNNTFKTNPFLERAVMTGITRVSRESMYSDLNNLKVVTMISNEYASCFGFTEEEVFAAMDEFGMENREDVRKWYDGFAVGGLQDIYNPWSIINFLDQRKLGAYWANTSSNGLAGSLLRKGDKEIKMQFEQLLSGRTIESRIDEEIVYSQLEQNESAVWSLLLAAGYLKVTAAMGRNYELSLTNYEVRQMFENMVLDWFCEDAPNYNGFVRSLLQGDLKAMNAYMNRMSKSMFSSFDGGNKPSGETNPERFYHGFVLGLLVDLAGRYAVASNRESGFGRYDVLLEPLKKEDDGIILEFKVHDPDDEGDLKETVAQALKQIEDKQYEQVLLDHGVSKDRIRKYGFAFEGKKVLIGGDSV
ncbi:hypothetical protein D7V82_05650 [bacterium 1xD8-6]|nr:hypothetical protein D7V72_06330 [bacterium D16-36]RKI71677.1 hypothetical protein D7V82_05650 [bacterium 1xD8-6]